MLFNSLTFFIFLAITWALYMLLQRDYRWQNALILAASLIFYGWWDWRFLSLILFTTTLNYVLGLAIAATPADTPEGQQKRRRYLHLSLAASLGLLGFFKYFNFFIDSIISLLNGLGLQVNPLSLEILLPVGISFFTFQTLSYTIDIYRQTLQPTRDFIRFAAFVAFFPQLVAGPIERAANLLPQFGGPRRITPEGFNSGLYLLLWGLFKKIVIADRMALLANEIFNNYTRHSGLDIGIGVLAFGIQIYCDFSAYSDIARGVARFFGFELMVNFRLPYFALNPSDFWNRWHISLSSWLRDYLYIPLGGNRGAAWMTYRNLFLTMLLGGLWHGAAWNFVIWGAYHGLILIAYRRLERRPVHEAPWGGQHSPLVVILKWALMFTLVMIGWLFFRATSLEQIVSMMSSFSLLASSLSESFFLQMLPMLLVLALVDGYQYVRGDLLAIPKLPTVLLALVYSLLIVGMIVFAVRETTEFIYFQF
jgi:D-alanyl-lipoteichoic acid acyltransferase DltB (MBOAT superfamily)